MNHNSLWLCFFYNGNQNGVCLIEFVNEATPISHDDEVRQALQDQDLSIEYPVINGYVDVSDVDEPQEMGIVIDDVVMKPKLVRVK